MDVKLVLQRGTSPGQAFRLRSTEMIIGRQKGCGVRIPSGQVSRQHCLVTLEEDLVRVEDLTSANGTFINGRRIKKREVLRPGDKLAVGPITFIVHYQLSQLALDRLLKEGDEQVEAVPLDEVEVMGEAGGDVELVLDGDHMGPLVPDEPLEGDTVQPENADPLEAMRQLEASAKAPPAPKRRTVTAPSKPARRRRVPPRRPAAPPPVPPRRPAPVFDEVEILGESPRPPKRVKLAKPDAKPAPAEEEPIAITPVEDEEAEAATSGRPDASMILGHKNWDAPKGQDLREHPLAARKRQEGVARHFVPYETRGCHTHLHFSCGWHMVSFAARRPDLVNVTYETNSAHTASDDTVGSGSNLGHAPGWYAGPGRITFGNALRWDPRVWTSEGWLCGDGSKVAKGWAGHDLAVVVYFNKDGSVETTSSNSVVFFQTPR